MVTITMHVHDDVLQEYKAHTKTTRGKAYLTALGNRAGYQALIRDAMDAYLPTLKKQLGEHTA